MNEVTTEKAENVKALTKLLEDVAKWNTETFVGATKEGQLAKLDEELLEVFNAEDDHVLEELADVFIVLGGLLRFGKSCIGTVIGWQYLSNMDAPQVADLIVAIKAKMEINKERTAKGLWKKQPDGSWHH